MNYRQVICGTVLLVATLPVCAGSLPNVPYVQVSGHGAVKVAPDMLDIRLTVTRTDLKLAVARADVEKRSSAVIALAKKLGIAARDIRAQVIYITPEYTWQNNQRKYAGQRVTRTFDLTLRKLESYPALVDGLVKIGVSSVDAVTPSRSDLPALRARALAAAMQDAHDRAQVLAQTAGAALDPVFSISEQGSTFNPPEPRPLMMDATRAASAANYTPGSLDIRAGVSVVYLLKMTVY